VNLFHSPKNPIGIRWTPIGMGQTHHKCYLQVNSDEIPSFFCHESEFFRGVRSMWTPHKNCTQQELNQAFNSGTNSNCKWHTLPLCHCGLLYLVKLWHICNLWLNWETYLLLFNMGHMIYVRDQFFDGNSMAVSIL
jgi:predicted nucleic acid binding AN1-type Zn finger protein